MCIGSVPIQWAVPVGYQPTGPRHNALYGSFLQSVPDSGCLALSSLTLTSPGSIMNSSHLGRSQKIKTDLVCALHVFTYISLAWRFQTSTSVTQSLFATFPCRVLFGNFNLNTANILYNGEYHDAFATKCRMKCEFRLFDTFPTAVENVLLLCSYQEKISRQKCTMFWNLTFSKMRWVSCPVIFWQQGRCFKSNPCVSVSSPIVVGRMNPGTTVSH